MLPHPTSSGSESACSTEVAGKEREIKLPTRSRTPLWLCVLAVLGVGLPFAPGAAQATVTGTVVAWGCGLSDDFGQCSVPSGLSGVTAIAAGYSQSLALKGDGTVVAWGCFDGFDFGQCSVPGGLSGVTAIAAGSLQSLALKNDGTVVAWGCHFFDDGQCSVPGGLSDVTAIAAGDHQSLALKGDGTVVAWGCSSGPHAGECSVPGGLSGVTAIAAGEAHNLALEDNGTVVAWGCGGGPGFGQCSVPSGLSGVTAIAAGYAQSLALKGDGTVVAWGCSGPDYGQCSVPNGLSSVTAIAADDYSSLALKADGTVVSWGCGATDAPQCSVPSGLCAATGIAAGENVFLALAKVCQTISFGSLPGKTFGDPDFAVSASASSGLPVSFSASGSCAASAASVHITGAGSCSVTASQPGDAVHLAAADVSQSFAIAKAGQSITFRPLANKTYGAADFTVSGTASSGLPISFAGSGNCAVSTATVHLTGAGLCTVTASQPGDANYTAASDISNTFSIARAPCTVPNVVGKKSLSARLAIARKHCRTGKVSFAYSNRRKKGIVLAQSRRPGRVLPAGSMIALVVSRGHRR